MKTKSMLIQSALLVTMLSLGIGCAKNGASSSPVAAPTTTTTTVTTGTTLTTNPGVNQFTSGASATFAVDNMSVMTAYVATHPLNNPQNLAINVNLSDIGSGRYAGTVKFTYQDNGSWYTGQFETGTGYNQVSYHDLDLGKPNAEFNQFFTFGGKEVFHGFFQDQYGAVVLVIDKTLDLGDGLGPSSGSGSLWFKNFAPTYATQSPEKCWFIRIGPYDCRAFVVGDLIQTTSALYPDAGYQRLGTFDGLDIIKGFNK